MKNMETEEAVEMSMQLALKVLIILASYGVLALLPPLQKLAIPGVFFKPVDLLKVTAFGLVSFTLFLSRMELSKKFGEIASKKIPVTNISNLVIVFFALLFVYYGTKDLTLFPDQKGLGDNPWFLWSSMVTLAIPVVGAGVVFYKNSEAIVKMFKARQAHKRHDSKNGQESGALVPLKSSGE